MTNTLSNPEQLMRFVHEFHTSAGMPTRTVPQAAIPEKTLRIALIDEEVNELQDALREGDFIEVIDALADIAYVTAGAAWCHGFTSFNLREVRYIPKEGVTPHLDADKIALPVESLVAVSKLYSSRLESGQGVDVLESSLSSILRFCYSISAELGVNLEDVLAEVQRSNMSKFDKDGKPFLNPTTGKVMKGPDFTPPNIGKVIFGE